MLSSGLMEIKTVCGNKFSLNDKKNFRHNDGHLSLTAMKQFLPQNQKKLRTGFRIA